MSQDKPVRIQRKRTKGWKMPPNTVYVGRPTIWGNPYRLDDYSGFYTDGGEAVPELAKRQWAVGDFNALVQSGDATSYQSIARIRAELRGKNLTCWCPLDQPCHADVLLEIANG